MEIPYYVAGGGGRGLSPHVTSATGFRIGDHTFDSSLRGYGYLTITVTSTHITIFFTEVDASGNKVPFDKKIVVDLATNKIV